MENYVLSNGVEIPVMGFGTFPLHGEALYNSVKYALEAGYNMFDTSSAYQNESELGDVLRKLDVNRKDIFITTKLCNADQRSGDIFRAFDEALERLQLDYIDLYLLHWPNPETYVNSWGKVEELYKMGKIRAIGVSNFHKHHFEELYKKCEIKPMINQIEIHPLLSQNSLIEYCKNEGMLVEAYSPLARMHPKLICNEKLIQLSEKYNKTIPQLILRWNYQKNIIVIPKASSQKNITDNISIFDWEISKIDMDIIEAINENLRVRHDPDNCDFTKL